MLGALAGALCRVYRHQSTRNGDTGAARFRDRCRSRLLDQRQRDVHVRKRRVAPRSRSPACRRDPSGTRLGIASERVCHDANPAGHSVRSARPEPRGQARSRTDPIKRVSIIPAEIRPTPRLSRHSSHQPERRTPDAARAKTPVRTRSPATRSRRLSSERSHATAPFAALSSVTRPTMVVMMSTSRSLWRIPIDPPRLWRRSQSVGTLSPRGER